MATLAASAALPGAAWAQQGPYYDGHMWNGGMWDDGWHWLFGPLMMILLVALVVVGVAALLRWSAGAHHHPAPHAPAGRSALDILKERFARGEIDKEEFEERRRTLGD